MIAYRGIPGIEVVPFRLQGGPLRVVISRAPAPGHSQGVREAWKLVQEANPKAFDGPILASMHVEEDTNCVHARRESYARLAVADKVQTGVRILSVTGVLLARDRLGREHVLLGKRGTQTRVYADQWELGPSGGLQQPSPAVEELDEDAVLSHLQDEVQEEVGLTLRSARSIGLCRDMIARSDDIVFLCDVGYLEDAVEQMAAPNWEYSQTLWLPIDSVEPWEAHHAKDVIAPTRALLRALGWIRVT